MDNEQMLKEKLADVFEWLDKGGEFVAEQAPLYAQEVIAWEINFGIASVVVGLVLLSLFAFAARHLCKFGDRMSEGGQVVTVVSLIVLGFLTFFTTINALCAGSDALKALSAPRVVVMQHITSMLAGVTP